MARPIVNMTTEIKVPGAADKINVPGTIEQVVAFLDTTYPGYEWPADEDYSATSSQFSPEDNTIYCNIGEQGSYFTAAMTQNFLRHFGYHKLSVGPGPGNCYRATCRTELGSVPVAFYLCNDVSQLLRAAPSSCSMRFVKSNANMDACWEGYSTGQSSLQRRCRPSTDGHGQVCRVWYTT